MVEIESDDIVILILSILAQAYITPRLPKISEGGILSILNDPTTQALLVIAGLFLVARKVWHWIRNLLSRDDVQTRWASVHTISNPPDTTLYNAVIRYDGVDWDGQFGLTRGSEISYVTGPSCPVCGSPLETRTKHRRIRRDKDLWDCPSCNFDTDRSHRMDGTQREAVESILENEANIAIEAVKSRGRDDVQSVMEDVIDRAIEINSDLEDHLENPDEVELSDEMMDDIHQAIDEVVDEAEIRQNSGLRAVLEHDFDYILPARRRNYEVVSDSVNEQQIRRRIR